MVAVDGGWSQWGQFSPCSDTCGDSSKIRTRSCNNPAPSDGGKECPGDFFDRQDCIPITICPTISIIDDYDYLPAPVARPIPIAEVDYSPPIQVPDPHKPPPKHLWCPLFGWCDDEDEDEDAPDGTEGTTIIDALLNSTSQPPPALWIM